MNDSNKKGLPYLGSIPGSPADKAGLRKGDEIIAVNGMALHSWDDFADALAQRRNPMVVDLIRNGQYMEIQVILSDAPVIANPTAIVAQLQNAGIFPKTEEMKEEKDELS